MKLKFKEVPAPFPGQRTWIANGSNGGFVILSDDGFTASFKRTPFHQRTDIIGFDDSVKTFEEAEQACQMFEGKMQ